jgi:hypothetical protein
MEREECERHVVENRRRTQYEADYGHPVSPVPNPNRQPRSQIVAAARDDDVAQVGDSGDDMAITAFLALAPRLRSVAYPDNFKPIIQKYDGRSDPNIWLSTYYVDLLRRRQGGRRQLRPHGGLLPAGDGRRTVALAQQPLGRQHHVVSRPVSGLHVELSGDL